MQHLVTHTSLRTSLTEGNSPPPADLLGRDGFVEALRNYLAKNDAGTIVSVEGPWGSGKTHVLHSLAWKVGRPGPVLAESDVPPAPPPPGALVYWLNPWLQRDVDLIGTLVLMIVEDIVASEKLEQATSAATGVSDGRALTTTDESLVLGDTDRDWPGMVEKLLPELIQLVLFGVAAVGTAVGGTAAAAAAAPAVLAAGALWPFLQTSAPAIAQLVTKVRAARVTTATVAADTNDHAAFAEQLAASCGAIDSLQNALEALRDLVSIARGQRAPRDQPHYVFIDDLDRCLPQTQVAVLQQLYWLSSSGASLVIVVGIDASMLESALRVHYQSKEVDAHRYLQKLFALRVDLPRTHGKTVEHLLASFLSRSEPLIDAVSLCTAFIDVWRDCGIAPHARDLERLADAMRLWSANGVPLHTQLSDHRWQAFWGCWLVNPEAVSLLRRFPPADRVAFMLRAYGRPAGENAFTADERHRSENRLKWFVFDSADGRLLFRLLRLGANLRPSSLDGRVENQGPVQESIQHFVEFVESVQNFTVPSDTVRSIVRKRAESAAPPRPRRPQLI